MIILVQCVLKCFLSFRCVICSKTLVMGYKLFCSPSPSRSLCFHFYRSYQNEIASIAAVFRFRRALAFIQQRFPFSLAFGIADSREACVESAQEVYKRLMLMYNNDKEMSSTEDKILKFETIAILAIVKSGQIDQEKAKALIKLFRPDRQGNLSALDFVKSVDAVYREFRLLDASIENSSQIDRAFENIFNIVFYIILLAIVLSHLGLYVFVMLCFIDSALTSGCCRLTNCKIHSPICLQ
jgi:hypothetical protein